MSFSTDQLEYFPTITGGDEHLIYTHREILGTQSSDENLFEGALGSSSESGKPLRGYLNSPLNEGASSISARWMSVSGVPMGTPCLSHHAHSAVA